MALIECAVNLLWGRVEFLVRIGCISELFCGRVSTEPRLEDDLCPNIYPPPLC